MYDLNTHPNTSNIAFSDDLIIYVSGTNPSLIQNKLEEWIEKVNNYYTTWNLRLNPLKCETILFRITARYFFKPTGFAVNNLKIETTIPGTNAKTAIPHFFYYFLLGFIVSWAQQVTPLIGLNILTLCTIIIQMRESNNNNNKNSNKQKNIYIYIYTVKVIFRKHNEVEKNKRKTP